MGTPPVTATSDPRELLTTNLELIRRIIRTVARRHRLSAPAAEELESAVWLRLVEHEVTSTGAILATYAPAER